MYEEHVVYILDFQGRRETASWREFREVHYFSHTRTITLSISLSHTHTLSLTHTHNYSLDLPFTHAHTLSHTHAHTHARTHTGDAERGREGDDRWEFWGMYWSCPFPARATATSRLLSPTAAAVWWHKKRDTKSNILKHKHQHTHTHVCVCVCVHVCVCVCVSVCDMAHLQHQQPLQCGYPKKETQDVSLETQDVGAIPCIYIAKHTKYRNIHVHDKHIWFIYITAFFDTALCVGGFYSTYTVYHIYIQYCGVSLYAPRV